MRQRGWQASGALACGQTDGVNEVVYGVEAHDDLVGIVVSGRAGRRSLGRAPERYSWPAGKVNTRGSSLRTRRGRVERTATMPSQRSAAAPARFLSAALIPATSKVHRCSTGTSARS